MANLRRGHAASRGSGGHMIRLLLMAVFIVAGLFYVKQLYQTFSQPQPTKHVSAKSDTNQDQLQSAVALHTHKGEIIQHRYYTLSYREEYEQAEWVSYEINKASLQKPNVRRTDWFEVDNAVSTGSAKHSDYSGSGYTRGHLVPAGDMAFDKTAMEETFFMSNMSPQLRPFNNGIWRELEEQVRDWVYQNGKLKIVSGPVIHQNSRRLKKGNITVPDAFYKVIVDDQLPVQKGIAFIIPHSKSELPLQNYIVSIDSLEKISGIDFYENQSADWQKIIEEKSDSSLWPISEARYKLRVSRWNNE
jgi:endonuclease G